MTEAATRVGIQEAGRATGVNPVTLRAWERRYGLVSPSRSSQGHRLYGDLDLRRINDIVYWIERGVPISKVRELLERPPRDTPRAGTIWDESLQETLRALEKGGVRRLDKQASQLLALYPLDAVCREWIQRVRSRLRARAAEPAALTHLALFEAVMAQKLGVRLLNLAPTRRQPGVLVAPLGAVSSLDVMMLALTVGQRLPVWTLYESPGRPAWIAWSASAPVRAILFSVSPSLSATALKRELGAARRRNTPVFAACPAGASAPVVPPGVSWLSGDREGVAEGLLAQLEIDK